jgi:hypothetical protein
MGKKMMAAVVFLLLALGAASAVNVADYGYSVLRRYEERGISYQDLQDAARRVVTVGIEGELTSQQASALPGLVDFFYTLHLIGIADLRVIFGADRTRVVLIPSRFSHDGVDLLPYLPSGMEFFPADQMEYEFRLRVENLFLRVAGRLINEREFASRLVQIVRQPGEYLRSQNPEYLLNQISLVQETLAEAVRQVTAENRAGQARQEALERDLQGVKEDYAALGEAHRALAERHAALDEAHRALAEDHNALIEKHAQLAKQHLELARVFGLLRNASMALHDRGLLGRISLPDLKAVERMLAIKAAEPSLTRDQMREKARGEGYDISKKDVTLVYAIYFNEFE